MATTPDNRPWAPNPIPDWIIKEFRRRQNDIGLEYPAAAGSVTWGDDGNWQNYKGPLTPWVRVFSNGTGKADGKSNYPEKSGFILQGGYGFDKSYGTTLNGSTLSNKNVLGYDAEGNEHTLDLLSDGNVVSFPNSLSNDKRAVQKFLPVPGITSIDAVIQKERIRKITINWKCYGYAQLEYMTPYFLSPKISAFVEFGWNHFNPASLLDLRNTGDNLKKLSELFTVSGSVLYNKNIRESYGLYDVTMGIVSGFDFSSQDGITFDCKTEILSKHANYSGVLVNGGTKTESNNTETNVQSSFAAYLEKRVTKLPSCIKQGKNFFEKLDIDDAISGSFIVKDFYMDGGVRKVEDRFFAGRKKEYGDASSMKGKSKYDWDYSDQKDIWVTFGFLVELANLFFKQPIGINKSDIKPFDLYEIETSDVVIGAHPNLISCDGNVLLIPNAKAPKFNAGIYYPQPEDPEDNDYQKQYNFGNPSIFSAMSEKKIVDYNKLDPYDRTVAKILRTGTQVRQKSERSISNLFFQTDTDVSTGTGGAIFRDNLDEIINRFRYNNYVGNDSSIVTQVNGAAIKAKKTTEQKGSKSFPRWNSKETVSGKPAGYWGNLNDLYVNVKVIIECAKSADTVENFYNALLQKINNAAGKIWDLAVIEDDSKLKIIDKKFVEYDDSIKVFQFDVGATNKFIKSISFTAQLSNVAANQVIAASSTTTKNVNGTVTANQPLQFPYGDRFNLIPPTPVTGSGRPRAQSQLVDNNQESIKQLQKSPQSSTDTNGSYIMSFKSYGPSVSSGPSRADAATAAGPRTTTTSDPNRPGTRAAAAAAAGPRTTTTSDPNRPGTRAAAAAAAGPRTTSSNQSSGKESGWNIVNLVLPNEALLIAIMNDLDLNNNSNIYGGQQPGFTVELTLQGISGLRTFQLFSLKNLPSPYSEREIICQIVDVSHKIDSGNWTTVIKAGIRSIKGKKIKVTTDGINEYIIDNKTK